MRKTKGERRKRKLAERVRREKEWAVKLARRAEFPDFVFDDEHANPEFSAIVREAVRQFDFGELPSVEQTTYKVMRMEGAAVAMKRLRGAMAAVRADHPKNETAQIGDIAWQLHTGELIFKKIPEPDRQRLFPLNDFCILLNGKQIVVRCSSLIMSVKTPWGYAYFSRFRPTVNFGSQEYVVAFSKAVIEKIQRRKLGNRMSYADLGDVYGYFELCKHFEPCKVWGEGDRRDELGDAITFFDDCSQERFWNHRYVNAVLGADFDPAKGKPYYRVGYCPVVFDGHFAKATSFLPPGFKKTPEYAAIDSANLSIAEKRRLQKLATDKMSLMQLIESDDFSAVRCFHNNGVPQVIQTNEEWFRCQV